jgi:hypothetical protein
MCCRSSPVRLQRPLVRSRVRAPAHRIHQRALAAASCRHQCAAGALQPRQQRTSRFHRSRRTRHYDRRRSLEPTTSTIEPSSASRRDSSAVRPTISRARSHAQVHDQTESAPHPHSSTPHPHSSTPHPHHNSSSCASFGAFCGCAWIAPSSHVVFPLLPDKKLPIVTGTPQLACVDWCGNKLPISGLRGTNKIFDAVWAREHRPLDYSK